MITIYKTINGTLQEIDTLNSWMWKGGNAYGLKMKGVEIMPQASGTIVVSPVYVPFIGFEQRAGQVTLDFHFWSDVVHRFIFQARFPWFDYTRISDERDMDWEDLLDGEE